LNSVSEIYKKTGLLLRIFQNKFSAFSLQIEVSAFLFASFMKLRFRADENQLKIYVPRLKFLYRPAAQVLKRGIFTAQTWFF